jgi:putative hydrolase of the HAD superfamily
VARLRGVLFDAGGTLVKVHTDRLGEALRARGLDPRARLDDAFWQAMVRMDAELGPGGDWEHWHDWWFARLAEHSDLPRDLLAEVWREADDAQHLWDDPLPGAGESLTRLREAGLRVGVVSNADGRIEEALGRAGLAELLEVIVDSGVVGVAKPDPAIFGYALGPLGLRPEEAWYLGDTVIFDARGADAAGLTSWVIDHRGLHTVAHPRRVSTLAEFTDLALAALAGRT